MPRPDPTLVDRRDYLRLSAGIAVGATAGLAGCSSSVPGTSDGNDGSTSGGDGSSATGLLSTAVSDQPGDIGDFESCVVTLDGIWVGPEVGSSDDGTDGDDEDAENETDAEDGDQTEQDDGNGPPSDSPGTGQSSSDDEASGSQDTDDGGNQTTTEPPEDDSTDGNGTDADDQESGEDGDGDGGDDGEEDGDGRRYFEFDEPQEADLTELQGEAQQLVGEHELSVGTYQFLQLDVAGIRGTLTDGSEASVDTPGNAPLKFNQSFDVREGYRTTFLADFTPVRRGNGSYLFQPVASETEVSYEQIESSEGESGDGSSDDESTDDGGSTTDANGDGADADGTTDGNGTSADGGNRTA